jgi:hypothetical protein
MEQLEAARAEVHEIVNRYFDKELEYVKQNPEDYANYEAGDFLDAAMEYMWG